VAAGCIWQPVAGTSRAGGSKGLRSTYGAGVDLSPCGAGGSDGKEVAAGVRLTALVLPRLKEGGSPDA